MMKKRFLYPIIPAGIVLVDQLVKWRVRQIPPGGRIGLVPGIIEIWPCRNEGIAFSLLSGRVILISILSMLLIAGVFWIAFRMMRLSETEKLLLLVLGGGAMGNLLDRLFQGSVTDYLRLLFMPFPVFNLADVCITTSVFALIVLILTDKTEEKPLGNT